jgi:hypothetical protein
VAISLAAMSGTGAARAITIWSSSRRSKDRPTDPARSCTSASVTLMDCEGIEAMPATRAVDRPSTTE